MKMEYRKDGTLNAATIHACLDILDYVVVVDMPDGTIREKILLMTGERRLAAESAAHYSACHAGQARVLDRGRYTYEIGTVARFQRGHEL